MSYYNPMMNQMNPMMNPNGPDPDDAPKGMKWATFIFLIFTFLLALAAMGVGIIELINDESDGDPRLLPFNPMGPKPEVVTGDDFDSNGQYLLKVNKGYSINGENPTKELLLLVPNNSNKGDYINMFVVGGDGRVGIRTTDDGKTPSNKSFSKTSYSLGLSGWKPSNGGTSYPSLIASSKVYLIFDGKQWNYKIENIFYLDGTKQKTPSS